MMRKRFSEEQIITIRNGRLTAVSGDGLEDAVVLPTKICIR